MHATKRRSQYSRSYTNKFLKLTHWLVSGTNLVTCHGQRLSTWPKAVPQVLWLEAKTHDNMSISIVNVHQATTKRLDLQRQVTLFLRATIDTALTQRRIMGGDFNAALSRYGYAQTTSALYDNLKVDKFFQDFVHSTHGTLIESEAHTRRDLLR